jgi:hypothetical protein
MGMLKTGAGGTSNEGKIDGLQDQDRYFCAIIPHHQPQHLSHNFNSESSISVDRMHLTPISNRRYRMTTTAAAAVITHADTSPLISVTIATIIKNPTSGNR